jgi:hypothetical protein
MNNLFFRYVKVTFLFTFVALAGCNQSAHTAKVVNDNNYPLSTWNKQLTNVIVEDLFTPPVASRIYGYANIAAYEVLVNNYPDYRSLQGQLNGLKNLPQPSRDKPCNFEIAACVAFCTVATKLVYSEQLMKEYLKTQLDSYHSQQIDESCIDNSVVYGKRMADSIIAWAKSDKYNYTRSLMRYTPIDSAGKWKPTPPDFTFAVEPYWGMIRTFATENSDQFTPPQPMKYDLNKKSEFWNATMEVYQTAEKLDDENKIIASYWDCNPNVSVHSGHFSNFSQKMTPGGHWIAITSLACRMKKSNFMETAEAFTMTAIALADAFKSCWNAKYKFNTIRPVTVINEQIDPNWVPYLQTPPFPEYPSGHSCISASAAVVLTHLMGEHFSFTDSSEVEYGMPVRSFNSFKEAAHEVMISRMYGGIHFRYGNEMGAVLGKKIGEYVVEKVKTRK